MLSLDEVILLSVRFAGDGVLGRTTLQKIVYLAHVLGLVDVAYRPYYHGPYSDDVFRQVSALVASGFVEERVESLGKLPYLGLSPKEDEGEVRRYAYRLTADGQQVVSGTERSEEASRLREIVDTCRTHHALNFRMLAGAAKVHYILASGSEGMSPTRIASAAKHLGWNLDEAEVERVKSLLEGLGLAHKPRPRGQRIGADPGHENG